MATEPEDDFIQTLRRYFTRIKNQEGETRQKFYTSRGVMSFDAQASDPHKSVWLAALDRLKAELLPPESAESPSSPPSGASDPGPEE